VALYARRARRDATAAAPVAVPRRARRGRVRRRAQRCRQAAAVHRRDRSEGAARSRRALGVGARARQSHAGGQRGRVHLHRHECGAAAAARGARREPRPRFQPGRLPAPPEAQRRLPRVPRANVRDRPSGGAGPRPGRRDARDPVGLEDRQLAGQPAGLLPLVLPLRLAGRLRISRAPAAAAARGQARRGARRRRAPARLERPRHHRRRPEGRAQARRRAARAALVVHQGRAEGHRPLRQLGPRADPAARRPAEPRPQPAPLPGRARSLRQPARRLRGQGAEGRQRRHRPGRRGSSPHRSTRAGTR
jgi:hypothetical protein